MNNSHNRVSELFRKYLSNEATSAESQEFLDYVNDPLYKEQIQELLSGAFDNQTNITDLSEAGRTRVLNRIFKDKQPTQIGQMRPYRLWPQIAAAAAIILITGAGLFYYNHQAKTNQPTNLAQNDIKPGGNKAYLTLANGSRITLTNARNGQLAKQAGITITKTANGQVVYSTENTNHTTANPNEYNTIATPKGGQYQVRLPDGTEVWLNAASSLTYPASFAALKERKVELHGEAYFEVTKDKFHPFIVATDKQEVKVLGTHFNINAYDDEPDLRTTLLEGSVRITKNNNTAILKPGEQSIVNDNTITVKDADTEAAVAWKNGYFEFKKADIKTVMRQLSRWYDVDIAYEGNIPDRKFSGEIDRNTKASRALEGLSFTKIHFRIEGKKIIVTP